ncbi:MAG: copper chaperone PCu(A)C [Pseudomonadota bacterium]
MHKTILFILLALLTVACNQKSTETIQVSDAWVREAPPNVSMLAGYANIKNNSAEDRTITSARSNQFKMVEIHKTIVEDGVAKMRRQNNLIIRAGKTLKLKPGSYHLMLMHPQSNLKLNDEVNVTITVKNGDESQEVDIVLPIQKAK